VVGRIAFTFGRTIRADAITACALEVTIVAALGMPLEYLRVHDGYSYRQACAYLDLGSSYNHSQAGCRAMDKIPSWLCTNIPVPNCHFI
jgi:hypothetical protein